MAFRWKTGDTLTALYWVLVLFVLPAFFDCVLKPWLGVPSLSRTTNRWCEACWPLIFVGLAVALGLFWHLCLDWWPCGRD